ncbi:hemerythrin [candidate division GN15 bacterium]|nr:hemerythrin [candidate division GN15 bacterium]
MKPTAILSNEHRVIEVVLTCLEQITDTARKNGKLDRQAAETAIDIIRNFADRCHHGKEEDHLFKALQAKGMPSDSGPIGQMLNEHEEGRAYVKKMADNIAPAADGDTRAISNFSAAAGGYVAMLRAHIQKEDRVLFPMAERFLTVAEQEQMVTTFQHVESDKMGDGTHGRYLDLVRKIAEQYGVSTDALAGATCNCGH